MKHNLYKLVAIVMVLALTLPMGMSAQAASPLALGDPVSFTIMHTNDFHGQLENKVGSNSNPGAARTANVIQTIRTAKEALGQDVLVFDAGDMMQGSLLSNIYHGEPVIDYYKLIGYDAVTFGNHEFDWGQATLTDRALQAADTTDVTKKAFPLLAANITAKVGDSCAGWDPAVLTNGIDSYTVQPYKIFDLGPADNLIQVGVIGVSSVETPYITVATATAGLCFKDPAESISHYYAEMLGAGADFIVVLSHNGFTDGGYGYGFPVYGDQTLAARLNTAGTPANIIIGGHSHTNTTTPTIVGNTYIAQAYYNGRVVGQFDVTYHPTDHTSTIAWTRNAVSPDGTAYAPVATLVTEYATDPDYVNLINQEIGWTQVDLTRNYNGDGMMGSFIQDAVYGDLNTDAEPTNDVDMVFNNPGGIRTDLCAGTPCVPGELPSPFLLTYGNMFTILPFGNATAVGDMTGAHIRELLNQSATLFRGALSVAGVRHKFYCYSETTVVNPPNPCAAPWAWGAYDIEVKDKTTGEWLPLDLNKTYRVATNEFLAPAGQDGFTPFKYMTNITYWGDMLDNVNRYVSAHYTQAAPYLGPNGDATLDGRVTQEGNNISGPIIPITILHHNDSHGRLLQSGSTPGYTNLVTAIKQERAHNPNRTLLLSSGDNIQGDSMMYYFKSAGLGYAADGTALPPALQINPLIKAFNTMGYSAMTLGNHEYNFGKEIFGTLSQANFPLLQANVDDTGEYGLDLVPVRDFTRVSVGPEAIQVAVMGIGNHRVPSYELPSNIPGLTFSNPIETAAALAPGLANSSEVLVALTHIGFTSNPANLEVDNNVDTVLAQTVNDIDVVVGGHSHTAPSGQFLDPPYAFLPTTLVAPDGGAVLVSQANRYNTYLGQIVLGMRQKPTAGINAYELVSSSGKAIQITTSSYPEDTATRDLIQPYADLLSAYNDTIIGTTITPIDTDPEGYTEETNGANLQADAAVWKLEKELGINVDFHLSGAMTNRLIATSATVDTPYTLRVTDMFSAMPYENSLLVISMNGPQVKRLLERAYRNYYYYKYFDSATPRWGGYSHYTTCMIDIDAAGKITYVDTYPLLPNGNNVRSLEVNGVPIDFNDAETFYNVSSVNYLAAGACNNSDGGVTLWPLDQIVADTQFYVRDAVTEYIQSADTPDPINPQVEGRLVFASNTAPVAIDLSDTTNEDIVLNGTLTATDTDNDVLTYTVVTTTTNGTLVVNSDGTFIYTPSLNWFGEDVFTFSVDDGHGGTSTGTATITVASINDAPVAPVIADEAWLARVAGNYAIPAFTDVDGDTLAYTATLGDGSALPAWLSFDDATLTFSGTPANVDAGDYVIKVAVADGHGGTAEATFTLTVTVNEVKVFIPFITR